MRMGEVTAVAPLDSPELSPAMSYDVVFLLSPACVTVARVPFVSRCHRGGSQPGPRRSRPRWRSLAHALWAAESDRAGPAVE